MLGVSLRCACATAILTAAALPASAQTIKFSYPVSSESTMGQTVSHFGELVEEKSGGSITVRPFPDAQLGNEIQSISSAQGGIVEMAVTTTAGLASLVPDFDLFQLPFTFSSYEQLDTVTRGPVGVAVLDKMEASGLKGLCYWDYGFRNITNNQRPVETLADVSGLRIRTIQNKVYIDSLGALGINPTPLPFPETFTALETGAIDGNEIANDVTRASSFYEVQDHLTETRHFTTISVVYASKTFWDGLSADQQTAVQDACAESSVYNRDIINASSEETLQFLEEQGMQISEISNENLQEFRDAVAPVVEQVSSGLDQQLVEEFNAAVAAAAQ
ncbi:DctP family TRAP transporter solute-binding subunit [Pelagibacterium sp.]|uniref:DctP family TRAP transporter solute-binding subunit n=1 Tax=Pelagibacterium sp. TaxID=1967288 RepID=UPI003A90420F